MSEVSCDLLDLAFYASFYSLSAIKDDPVKLREHFLTIGKQKGYFPNKDYADIAIAKVISFDGEIYANLNIAFDNMTLSLRKARKMETVPHCLAHYYDPVHGNLYHFKHVSRVANELELVKHVSKWEKLYSDLMNAVEFNEQFYSMFYEIPAHIETRNQLFMHWLKHSMHIGHLPSKKYLQQDNSVIVDVQRILNQHHIDMHYIESVSRGVMEMYAGTVLKLDLGNVKDASKMLYLLFNAGEKMRIYFNESEYVATVQRKRDQFADATEKVKLDNYKTTIEKAESAYAKELAIAKSSAFKLKDTLLVKISVDGVADNMRMLKHIVSDQFIEQFEKSHNVQSLVRSEAGAEADASKVNDTVCIQIVKKVLNNLKFEKLDDLNCGAVKQFVVSFLFNLLIKMRSDKTEKQLSKEEYLELVKVKSIAVLEAVYQLIGVVFTSEALKKDIEFIIANKQFIKLYKLSSMVLTLF